MRVLSFDGKAPWTGACARLSLGATLVAGLALCPSAMAAAITVNSTAETVAADGFCTLPEAVKAANQNSAQGGCPAGGSGPAVRDTIRFALGNASPGAPHVIELTTSPLDPLTDEVVIDGTEPPYDGPPVIEIRENAPGGAGAIVIGADASGSLIDGLAITVASGSAIVISGSAQNVITGNHLGIGPTGTGAGQVAGSGVTVIGSNNQIGGTAPTQRNLIATNGLDGISIEDFGSQNNALLGNSIRANGPDADDLAIDLNTTVPSPVFPGGPFDGDGRSPNDNDDSDNGANGAQNHPVLTAAVPQLSLIRGELQSTPGTGHRIEIFASAGPGRGGSGLAERFLGRVVVGTNASGFAEFGLITSPGSFSPGEWVSATATPQTANATALGTSEVSPALAAPTCDVEGTPGDDVLVGTSDGEVICGYGGNDTIEAGDGTDFLLGGDGNDTLRGGGGSDAMFGEAGFDTADYSLVNSNVNASLAAGLASQDGQGSADNSLSSIEALVGGPDADVLTGDDLENVIDGRAGDDVVNSGGAIDTVNGGHGNDAVNGGDGPDRLFGGDGEDIVSGGNDADEISGGAENDSLDGGSGNDSVMGDDGDDTLAGLEGADLLVGAGGRDRLEGGGARDLMSGGPGSDRIDGDRGNDRIEGQGGKDRLNGGQAPDQMSGGTGNDIINGAGGSDRMRGGKGNDVLGGGGGTDKMFGDDGKDRFVGGSGKNVCDGGKGRDVSRTKGCVTKRKIP